MYKCFKKIANTEKISSWESKGLSNVIIKLPSTPTSSNIIINPELRYLGTKVRVRFDSCLKQVKIT